MPVQITISVDTRAVERALSDMQRRQLPFATSVALNDTARDVQLALRQGTSVFDRPSPKTVRGTRLTRSSKTNLVATVGLLTREDGVPVDEYLSAQVVGGSRADKRSELLLQRAGILPPGKQTRPGSGARLDAYGNMSRGQIVQILSFFRTFGGVATSGRARGRAGTVTASQAINRKQGAPRRALEFFVVREGQPGLATGIWQRTGRQIKPVLIFIDAPNYRPRYDFAGIATKTVAARINANFDRALKRALATAR